MNWPKRIAVIFFALIITSAAIAVSKHRMALVAAERSYQEYQVTSFNDFGSTQTLSVLPLINWHASSGDYKSEQGVSYLIKTDTQTVLFDVGHNQEKTHPSPLEHNMKVAGVQLQDIDTIFISHNHFDHVGGKKWMRENTFSLGNEQIDLTGKKVFTPTPMTYPGINPQYTPEPTIIGNGLATTGTIARKLSIGPIDEQVLAINVKGKGIVLVVGCGHQTTAKTIERAQRLFKQPIYGVIGDLHYPVPDGRINIAGINAQKVFASGDGIFKPLTQEQINIDIELLKSLNLNIMALGGHDSSDKVIEQFSQVFADNYRYVKAGQWISVAQTNNQQNVISN